jgi:hypothetical protein
MLYATVHGDRLPTGWQRRYVASRLKSEQSLRSAVLRPGGDLDHSWQRLPDWSQCNIGGKSAAVNRGHMNTMKIVRPALHPGKYGIVITNPDGETASADLSFAAI